MPSSIKGQRNSFKVQQSLLILAVKRSLSSIEVASSIASEGNSLFVFTWGAFADLELHIAVGHFSEHPLNLYN